ncbi:cytochrome o ubiquinol oxidase subunit IV [Aureimonas populi]|uniref:Cytochrome bo(3) ubiquinol oxidase subunit 4 n=1 Tax=Aureimonas populi TaxID=1701758 RepID=A0ABW5CNE9_9HYPH|nr:cytochrome o ubiquinol oxidase subunit IV [Aureimonas populi]
MSDHSHSASAHADAHGAHGHDEHAHGTVKGYLIGFALSVLLTAVPFALVMGDFAIDSQVIGLVIMGFAVVQIVVHMVYFLHMNTHSEGGWNILALMFTIVITVIMLAGSLWVMYHLNVNMMMPMGGVADQAIP